MKEQLTAVFQKVPEGYIAFVEELPGANTQGDTLDEARTNLQEAVQLVLESNRALAEESLRNKTVNRSADKTSTVPRHREINDFLARKICKDLEVPKPSPALRCLGLCLTFLFTG